ncbi:hypothetical protein ACOI1C_04310 [Bacillus sp. DJP31]|uniref:hypothetical protein n=1 Tax=Bacillus sp. DJP31 TaxID=3409789 RepID=UPI003BB80A3B
MEIKYKENPLWKVTGAIWLVVALLNLGLLLFMLGGSLRAFGLIVSPLLLLTVVASTMLSVFYFRLKNTDYLKLNNNVLSIHIGLIRRRKEIAVHEIEKGVALGSKYILLLKDGKEVTINQELMKYRDFEELKAMLEQDKYVEM